MGLKNKKKVGGGGEVLWSVRYFEEILPKIVVKISIRHWIISLGENKKGNAFEFTSHLSLFIKTVGDLVFDCTTGDLDIYKLILKVKLFFN